ncbi:alpha-galactosidase [Pullulanibacillus pueri]|uniref:Alpha-galactosidase n=1 Tax=Pullulanibacillus pueri TaxID=1437324 RepID=A0A8J2ZYC3_9BACL|nr:alpha-galactosidase [Pullulanibacillus pueri]MBM7682898.1 alpha-galactosidase [Pullulanibacillus pueri]GGH84424.1 alpha-galactosidase [Pullulanibacillus pueri]
MPIYFNEVTKEFHLQNESTSYIFKVLQNGQLGSLYYGKAIQHQEAFPHFYYQREMPSSTFLDDDPTFSLDMIKQEYPSYGTTDFREPAIQITQENGSRISDFKYKTHRIVKGKPKLKGLPASYAENEEEVTTLIVTLYDEVIQAECELYYSIYETYNVLTRSTQIINKGEQALTINRLLSTSIDFPDSDYECLQLSGTWARERHIKTRKLQPGIQSISSTRGTSSAQQNPFIALKREATTENQGEVYGFNLVYSGNFLAQVEVDPFDVARVMIGINPFDFSWRLEQGESFQTPEAVCVYSDQGLNKMSQIYHQFYRERMARGKWRDRERPVLINNWEATYFDFNEEKLLEIARTSKNLGVELFVLDDGWFGRRDNDRSSLGDWFVDTRKLPNGIKGLANKIKALGLDFGLWFEPEMVSKVSELYEQHPDWIIHVPDRTPSQGRHQYVLDFSRKEVVDYIFEKMCAIIDDASISYIKWDMNRNMTEIGSFNLTADRQQEVAHRYILGVYDLYERLTTKYPEILFESCASGGARFDPGMLYYAPQAWTSDDTDAIERLKIQYGTSMVYPISSIGAHVSAVPNHQVGRLTSLETRANVAYFGAFGYELNVNDMTKDEQALVQDQIEFFKKHRRLFQYGTFYRLISPFESEGVTSWMVVSADQDQAIFGYYQALAQPNVRLPKVKLLGLDPTKKYQLEGHEESYHGDELMHFGLHMEQQPTRTSGDHGDYQSKLYVFRALG